jgi:hypothetical protein
MQKEELRKAIRAQPFRPFRIHMGGGRALDVHHPDYIMLSPTGRTAAIFSKHDGLEIIDVVMVQSIEFVRNGASRRRKSG